MPRPLYYVAPNVKVPFKWVAPGGFAATVLILTTGAALDLYADNLGPYNQTYGQVDVEYLFVVPSAP